MPKRKQYEKEAMKTYRSARSVLIGTILRYGSKVMKKKKKEKKMTFVFFKDQRLNPKSKKVIPMKLRVRTPKIGLEKGKVYEAE
jgi:hypothetical protein